MPGKIPKGFTAEENLRVYFLSLGYYALRGVKLRSGSSDLTDIDLLLFGRNSPLSRERINVDCKNKKSPQAIERIFFASGIKSIFGYNHCIVATTSTSSFVSKFAEDSNVTLLDGNFLKKTSTYQEKYSRLTEEEFTELIRQNDQGKFVVNYLDRYELSKSRLASNIDFSTISELLSDCKFFADNSIKDHIYKNQLCRCLYLTVSLFLIAFDYVNKDLVILSDNEREKRIYDGFSFGSLGRDGSEEFINKAFTLVKQFTRLDETEVVFAKKAVEDAYVNQPMKVLSEFFSKSSTIKELYKHAKELETIAFATEFQNPQTINPLLRSIIFVLLDYFKIDRTLFVDIFNK